MIALTFEEAILGLGHLVAEKPDHKYEKPAGSTRCQYAHDGEPGCIVGHLFYRRGVPLETLHHWDEIEMSSIGALIHHGVVQVDRRTRALLTRVQGGQDNGMTWAGALLHGLDQDAKDEAEAAAA